MITIERIHESIVRELRRIDEIVPQIAQSGDDAANAEANYKSEFAKQRLSYRALNERATVGATDDHATEACADLHLAHLLAANRLTTCRESLRASQARLDGLRSLLSSFKVAGG